MKLLKLHIDNFGVLSNYDYEFKYDLNMIKEENGFGKTTLGAFIKVMFYGFENEGKTKIKRERLKYEPWQGGTYGGSVCFEHNGKKYILSRTFNSDKKRDSFELIDANTKLESFDFTSENVGETLFDINRESFARTLFISQNNYSHSSFTDIDAKIGNLVDATDDLNNHDTAVEKINKLLDTIGSEKKGKLKEIKNELDNLKKIVLGKKEIENSIAEKESKIKDLDQIIQNRSIEKREIDNEIEEVAKIQDKQKDKQEYENLLNSYENNKKNFNEQKKNFPLDIPERNTLEELYKDSKNLNIFAEKMKSNKFNDEEQIQFQKLKQKYSGVDFSDVNFEEVKKDIKILYDKSRVIQSNELTLQETIELENASKMFKNANDFEEDNLYDLDNIPKLMKKWTKDRELAKKKIQDNSLSSAEIEELKLLSEKFDKNTFDSEKNDRMINNWKEYEQLKNVVRNNQSNIQSNSFLKNLLFMLGILLILVGIAFLLIVSNLKMVSIISIVAGVVLAVIGKFNNKKGTAFSYSETISKMNDIVEKIKIYFKSYKMDYDEDSVDFNLRNLSTQYDDFSKLKERAENANKSKEEAMTSIKEIEVEIKRVLERYNYEYLEANVLLDLNNLNQRYTNYKKLLKKKNDDNLIKCKKEFEILKLKVDSFFKNFSNKVVDVDEYSEEYINLVQDFKELNNFNERALAYNEAKENFGNLVLKITKFLNDYGFQTSGDLETQLNEIKEKLSLYHIYKESYNESKNKKQEFEKTHSNYEQLIKITDEMDENALSNLTSKSIEINNIINDLKEERTLMDNLLNSLNDNYNEMCEREEKIKNLENDKLFYTKKKSLLEKTKKYLEDAKNKLNAKYSAPLERALTGYFDELTENSDITIDINVKRELIIRSYGEQRRQENLSSGYKDLIDLCYRLALVKAMYPNEHPILILDDPFTNLDEKKLEKGLELIKKVSKDYQVLYFTCHDSRLLKA